GAAGGRPWDTGTVVAQAVRGLRRQDGREAPRRRHGRRPGHRDLVADATRWHARPGGGGGADPRRWRALVGEPPATAGGSRAAGVTGRRIGRSAGLLAT